MSVPRFQPGANIGILSHKYLKNAFIALRLTICFYSALLRLKIKRKVIFQ